MIEQQQGEVRFMQFAHYLQFPEITHASFTRLGGYSKTPYWGLNVSFSSGDDFENVLRNRLLTLQTLQLETYPCATLWLVHGADVAILGDDDTWEWRYDQPQRVNHTQLQQLGTAKPRWKADAIITRQRGVALALASADCVPLLFYDPIEGAIGMAHAGWRGTARGIAAATIDAMREQFGSRPHNIYVGIGPSIGPCCYEVTGAVQELFMGQQQFETMPTDARYRNLVRESAVFSVWELPERNSLRLDLWETNRKQLLMAGVLAEHIELPDICTSCETHRFFSHRGEHGKAGRFPSILALRNDRR